MDSPQPPVPAPYDEEDFSFAQYITILALAALYIIGSCTYEYVSHHCHREAQQDHDIESGAGTADAAITTTATAAEPVTIVYEKMEIQEGMEVCVECSVCMDEYKDGGECGVIPGCNHMYHKQCIDQWLLRKKECPVCRRAVTAGAKSIGFEP